MTAPAIPRATYRLQLSAGFGFAAAAELVPYLAKLGVSHCYFSPYLKTRPGSAHGYDVTDHSRLNPELGDTADYEALCARLAEFGMGQIVDIVPNHVGIMGSEGKWWLDVLENGQASQFAEHGRARRHLLRAPFSARPRDVSDDPRDAARHTRAAQRRGANGPDRAREHRARARGVAPSQHDEQRAT
jgi:glycosidase